MDTMIVARQGVAKAVSLSVDAERSLEQVELRFTVKMHGFGWDTQEGHLVHLLPTSANIALAAGSHQSSFICHADGRSASMLMLHAHEFELVYVHHVGVQALRAVEDARDGAPVTVDIWAHAGAMGVPNLYPSSGPPLNLPPFFEPDAKCRLIQRVSVDEWRSVVERALGARVVPIEVVVPKAGGAAAAALQKAVEHRDAGRHEDAVAAVRVALDEMKIAGFGGHTPQAILNFIKQNANSNTMVQRREAVQLAMHMFCSPPHHGGQSEPLTKEDSRFAVAVGAALLKLAESR